jgi:hypothetical protein
MFQPVYSHALRVALFSIHMLGLQVALGILDVWMARFGSELGRTGAA